MAKLSKEASEQIKEAIDTLGLKKIYVAEALGVPTATFSRWINRKQGITKTNLLKVYKILAINE